MIGFFMGVNKSHNTERGEYVPINKKGASYTTCKIPSC